MYRLLIKRSAERDLRRLPRPIFLRINQHILALGNDPRPPGVRKLKGALEGWRRRAYGSATTDPAMAGPFIRSTITASV